MHSIISELRLFISSTFEDLSEERAYLMRHVFPRIRTLVRERGAEFTEIDLRWGLTAEESTMGRVIRSCLEEIERCRPYFLGMLGDRYGWVPTLADVQKDYQLLERYPWIEDAAIDGASIVEIEFAAGLLRAQGEKSESAMPSVTLPIYSRSPKVGPDIVRIVDLERRLTDAGITIKHFHSLEELAEVVLEDLLALVDRDMPEVLMLPELARERRLHEAFAANRRRAYIVNADSYRRLLDFAAAKPSEDQSVANRLLVHGPSGGGKSALAAYFVEQWKKRKPNAFTIAHYVGACASGSDAYAIIRHITEEIRERYALTDKLPDTFDEAVQRLPDFLQRIQSEELLLVIDAVNQLPESDRKLTWLPSYLPPNIRLIVTTTDQQLVKNFAAHGWPHMELKSLGDHEREAIVVRFLGEYHKALSQAQLKRITDDPKTSSPLFLRTLLEEIRLNADFALLDDSIDHYLSARDINELFQLVLERLESDYGHGLVTDVLALIGASREGLSESELIELTEPDRSSLRELLIALDFHLTKPNGRYTFFHDYLRAAVQKRYLSNPIIARNRHRALGRYFATQPVSLRRIDEEPWQWIEAGDIQHLSRLLSDPEVLHAFVVNERTPNLLAYLNAADLEPVALTKALLHEDLKAHDPIMIESAARFLELTSHYTQSDTLYRKAVAAFEARSEQQSAAYVNCLSNFEGMLRAAARFDDAEAIGARKLAIVESVFPNNTVLLAKCWRDTATLLFERQRYAEAEFAFRKVVELDETDHGVPLTDLVSDIDSLGTTLVQLGELDKAEPLLRRAIGLSERLGSKAVERGSLLNNIGLLLNQRGQRAEAIASLSEAAKLRELLSGANSLPTLHVKVNLASIMVIEQQYAEAEAIFDDSIRRLEAIVDANHPLLLEAQSNRATLDSLQGRYQQAESLLLRVLDARKQSMGDEHPTTLLTYMRLARNYLRMGNTTKATEYFQLYLPVLRNVLGDSHPAVRDFEKDWKEPVS